MARHHKKGVSGSLPNPHRAEILEDAKQSIMSGQTLAQIAERYNISSRTLSTWLASMGDEYQHIREVWIDNMLLDAAENINNALDQLQLARAREQFKVAQFYADRRDRRYMPQQQVTTVSLDLTAAITAGRARAGLTLDVTPEGVISE